MSLKNVILPIAGMVVVRVEADSDEEAIEKAINSGWSIDFNSDDGVELLEIDAFEKIVQGNICYAPQWEAEVEDV